MFEQALALDLDQGFRAMVGQWTEPCAETSGKYHCVHSSKTFRSFANTVFSNTLFASANSDCSPSSS